MLLFHLYACLGVCTRFRFIILFYQACNKEAQLIWNFPFVHVVYFCICTNHSFSSSPFFLFAVLLLLFSYIWLEVPHSHAVIYIHAISTALGPWYLEEFESDQKQTWSKSSKGKFSSHVLIHDYGTGRRKIQNSFLGNLL